MFKKYFARLLRSLADGFLRELAKRTKQKKAPVPYRKVPEINRVELDLPIVVETKKQILHHAKDVFSVHTTGDNVESDSYKVLTADLRDTSQVEEVLLLNGFNVDLPTLWISECVLVLAYIYWFN